MAKSKEVKSLITKAGQQISYQVWDKNSIILGLSNWGQFQLTSNELFEILIESGNGAILNTLSTKYRDMVEGALKEDSFTQCRIH